MLFFLNYVSMSVIRPRYLTFFQSIRGSNEIGSNDGMCNAFTFTAHIQRLLVTFPTVRGAFHKLFELIVNHLLCTRSITADAVWHVVVAFDAVRILWNSTRFDRK